MANLKVPRIAWPPAFMNQQAKGFVFAIGDGTIVARSPNVVSVVKGATGQYTVKFDQEFPWNTVLDTGEVAVIGLATGGEFEAGAVDTNNRDDISVETREYDGVLTDKDFYFWPMVIQSDWFE